MDWLNISLVVLGIGLALDGFYRMWKDHKNEKQ